MKTKSKTRFRVRFGSTFGRRLAFAFAAVAILTAVLAAAILGLVWANRFDAYVRGNLQRAADGAALVAGQEVEKSGGWMKASFQQMPRYGVMGGFALQVIDMSGNVLYDDSVLGSHIFGFDTSDGRLTAKAPTDPTAMSPVRAEGEVVGYVRVWTYGSQGLLTDNDVQLRRSVFIGLGGAAVVAVLLASMAGLVYATSLVRPIERITDTADSLRAGDRDARTGMSGGDEIGMLGKTLDEMADAIEADREMERRLTADVAHELRTPLQAIQATVEAMQDGVLPADEERLGVVRDETIRLARLADGILELTRLERGSTPMRAERLDLAIPVSAAVDTHRALFDSCGLLLTVDMVDDVRVIGDADRLKQAVGNLLSNAARYTPADGRVGVAVRREGDQAVIEVTDTGIGVAEEDLGRVFSRFWRADEARDRSTGGLGIGLAVVKEIVDRHGGTVSVARRSEGGSVFTIRLPIAPPVT